MSQRWQSSGDSRSGLALAGITLVVGICLAAALGRWVHHEGELRAEADFERSAERVAADVGWRLRQPVYGLKGTRGMFAARGSVSRSEFRAYVESRDLAVEFPGMRGLGFVQRVARAELDAFLAATRADGAPQFAIRTLGEARHDDLWVVKFIEPGGDNANAGSLGLDLGSEALRRAAVEQAVDSGEATLSRAIAQAHSPGEGPGLLFFVPLYTRGDPPSSVAERRARLIGLVYAPVVMAELLEGIREAAMGRISVEVFDAPMPDRAGARLHAAGTSAAVPPGMQRSDQELFVPGGSFLLRVRSTPSFDASFASPAPWLVFGGGVLASAMLALLLRQLALGRERAERLAQRMTADLERLARVVQHTSSAVSLTDADLKITWINDGFTRINGYTLEEAVGHTAGELLTSPNSDPATLRILAQAAQTGEGCMVEVLNRAKDGRDYWLYTEIMPILDEAGRLNGFMEIGDDITERRLAQDKLEAALRDNAALLQVSKASEAALRASEAFLDKTGRIANVGGWEYDFGLRQMTWSEQTRRIHDFAPDHQPSIDEVRALFEPAARERIDEALNACLREGQTLDLELPLVTPRGRPIWVRINGAVETVNGQSPRLVGACQDITARRAMEDRLRRHNELMTSVLESLPCGLSVFDQDLNLVTSNTYLRRLLDLPDSLFDAQPVRYGDLVRFNAERGEYGDGDIEAKVQELTRRAQPPVVAHQFERQRPNGTWLEVRGAPMPGGGMITTFTDVTARHAAEAEVQRSAQLLRGAIETIDEAFVLFDPEDRLVFCNEKYRRVYPCVSHLIVPGARFEDLIRAGAERGDYRGALGRVDDWVAERMAAHRGNERSLTQRLNDGRTLRIIERRMPDGHTVGFRLDITELVRATEAAQDAARAKGQFLANMSHEIRTPMNAILGMLTLLGRTELSARQADYVDKTRGAAQSLLELLNDILDFSKVEAGAVALDPHPFRMDRLMHDVAVIAAGSVGTKPVEVRFDVDSNVPPCLVGDAMRLRQVLINLTGNAIKFTQEGEVAVRVTLLARRAEQATIEFAVLDTGIGIAPEHQQRIFSGFSQAEASTTRRFGGTGLGLAISQRLVALMGAELGLESAPGQGSRFHFRLSLALPDPDWDMPNESLGDGVSPSAAPMQRLAGLRLLVAEDNPNNQQVARELLEGEGALVQIAADGQAAVETVEQTVSQGRPGFDAVLMDLQMPVLDGYAATRAIRRHLDLPTLPIIAMTANALASDREACLAAGMNDHIGKPFDLDHLVQVLRIHTGRAAAVARPLPGTGPRLPDAVNTAAHAAGVNLEVALRRLGGKLEIYQRMLSGFVADLEIMPAQLQAQLSSGQFEGTSRLLHTLKGLAGTLGATALAREAERSQHRLATARADAQALPAIEAAVAAVSEAVSRATPPLAQLAQALHAAGLVREEAAREALLPEPDAATPPHAAAAAALRVLASQLRDADMSATDTGAALWHDFGALLGEPLRHVYEAVVGLDFDRALPLCENLLRSLPRPEPA